jgi:hypothetical protein
MTKNEIKNKQFFDPFILDGDSLTMEQFICQPVPGRRITSP